MSDEEEEEGLDEKDVQMMLQMLRNEEKEARDKRAVVYGQLIQPEKNW